jgi:hypothetical protein
VRAINSKIQLRHDTAANWSTYNPTLSAGEPGFETDTGKLKIGDGQTSWIELSYIDESIIIQASRVEYVNDTLDNILLNYIFDIDYETLLAFDTSELIAGSSSSSILGQAILGQLILG